MHRNFSPLWALGLSVAPSPFAVSQTATALLFEDGPIPGGGAETISSLSNTAVNTIGGYSVLLNTNSGLSMIWGSPTGAAGTVLRTESTIGTLQQTSFEFSFGMADGGQLSYGTTGTDTVTMTTGLDGLFLDSTLVLNEEDPVPTIPGMFSTFNSRPGIAAFTGDPYWVGGIADTPGASTQTRVLFYGAGVTPVLQEGDMPTNLIAPIGSNIDFDSRFLGGGHELDHQRRDDRIDGGQQLHRDRNDGIRPGNGAGPRRRPRR